MSLVIRGVDFSSGDPETAPAVPGYQPHPSWLLLALGSVAFLTSALIAARIVARSAWDWLRRPFRA